MKYYLTHSHDHRVSDPLEQSERHTDGKESVCVFNMCAESEQKGGDGHDYLPQNQDLFPSEPSCHLPDGRRKDDLCELEHAEMRHLLT